MQDIKNIMKRIQAISERLKKEYKAQKIILFGSYTKGKATEDSDVDLLIIAPSQERFFERMATVKRIVRDLRNGLILSPIVLTPEEVKKREKIGDQFVKEILTKGVKVWAGKTPYIQRIGSRQPRKIDDATKYIPALEDFRALCERVSGYYFAERYPRLVPSKLNCSDIEKDMEEAKRFVQAMFG